MAAAEYFRWVSRANGIQFFRLGGIHATRQAAEAVRSEAGRTGTEIIEGPGESLQQSLGEGDVAELRGEHIPFEPVAAD